MTVGQSPSAGAQWPVAGHLTRSGAHLRRSAGARAAHRSLETTQVPSAQRSGKPAGQVAREGHWRRSARQLPSGQRTCASAAASQGGGEAAAHSSAAAAQVPELNGHRTGAEASGQLAGVGHGCEGGAQVPSRHITSPSPHRGGAAQEAWTSTHVESGQRTGLEGGHVVLVGHCRGFAAQEPSGHGIWDAGHSPTALGAVLVVFG
mmetsp:Transcript_14631/g.35704  ORF Transcript_14631/g.35704 Transcript_14631/m.35704 type:complete len:205 (+) Transcript_14631:913-1527(+)